jgi:hypothetical protein
MKYVIVDHGGLEVPIIIPVFWNHSDVIRWLGGCKAISAGFLKRDDLGNLYVTGFSKSLNIGSRPQDLNLIISQLEFSL